MSQFLYLSSLEATWKITLETTNTVEAPFSPNTREFLWSHVWYMVSVQSITLTEALECLRLQFFRISCTALSKELGQSNGKTHWTWEWFYLLNIWILIEQVHPIFIPTLAKNTNRIAKKDPNGEVCLLWSLFWRICHKQITLLGEALLLHHKDLQEGLELVTNLSI